ncbi:hypothetical protein [Schumannella sp. 10F1B-5-1]|uniref:hypothetical protein n=1 Tax=Schumannella sp. 10F1B-5-1 TaxID=2590780 RepID=UPI001131D84A|nr:hypothetical protein [Schumannella sp. 10F1B-5-1]TPW71053.1 hypothetical protein FJ658_13270 [Schumannella sp. 10F1B-5-1]
MSIPRFLSPVRPVKADDGELPEAELRAAVLDGEVYQLGDGFSPSDLPSGPAERLAVVLRGRSPRLAAEGLTAAWVWGARSTAPPVLQLCCELGHRVAKTAAPDAEVRELTLQHDDLVRFGGRAVTSPLRTVVDLARDGDDGRPRADDELLSSLLVVGGIAIDDAIERLDRGRGLPGRRAARERLRRLTSRAPAGRPPRGPAIDLSRC